MSDFKDRITQLRVEKGLNQEEFAKALGVSKSTIGMWEIGKRYPSKALYEQIADFFNVDIDYLYCRTDIRQAVYFDKDGNMHLHNSNTNFASRMLAYYNMLNNLGKDKALEHIEMLTKIPDYTKPEEVYLNAANAIEGASEEDKKSDDDIMDDDEF